MKRQIAAIVWAQWRSMRNAYPRVSRGEFLLTSLLSLVWYGSWGLGAIFVGQMIAGASVDALRRSLPVALLFGFLYWQAIPVLMASMGASIDFRKLLAYPVPFGKLFHIDVLLRVTTGLEVLLLTGGAAAGLAFNPHVPWWGSFFFLPFTLLNMMVSVGVRDLLSQVFARKRLREIGILTLILAAGLPQLLLLTGVPAPARRLYGSLMLGFWPWTASAHLVTGAFSFNSLAAMAVWLAAGYGFGRWQFERGLRLEKEASEPAGAGRRVRFAWSERLFRIPCVLFHDPLGGLIEKELRFLTRAPRFRLVFLMGFSFGLMVWLPLAYAGGSPDQTFFGENFLTFVSVYALMLLGEVTFWNTFGFDRSATQIYYAMPLRFRTVLIAKNLSTVTFVLLELIAVAAVCLVLRLPVPAAKIPEAFAVTLVMMTYLLAIGNLSSTHYPRPVDPVQSWRAGGAGKFQAMLLLLYPLVSAPIAFAYLARWTFESTVAFYCVLSLAALLGAILYAVAMDSAVAAAEGRKESILSTLSKSSSPISMS
jgi:hypothetical protein